MCISHNKKQTKKNKQTNKQQKKTLLTDMSDCILKPA